MPFWKYEWVLLLYAEVCVMAQRVQVVIVSGMFVFKGADGFAVAVIALVLLAEVFRRRWKPAATRELQYDEPAQQRDRSEIVINILNYFRVKGSEFEY
jgi:hypothetical protein